MSVWTMSRKPLPKHRLTNELFRINFPISQPERVSEGILWLHSHRCQWTKDFQSGFHLGKLGGDLWPWVKEFSS